MSQKRLVQIEQDILAKNGMFADDVRDELSAHGVLALNLIASPGAGKTTLLVETLQRLKGTFPTWVIEGDQETTNDADRIRATDTQAVQINTGKGCHLDADMIQRALASLSLRQGGVLFIENVGNLACPAGFDLGEAHKVVILSVTEGDDKPVKYPEAFAAADLLVISKSDLAPYCDFDIEACVARAREVNPAIESIVPATVAAACAVAAQAEIDNDRLYEERLLPHVRDYPGVRTVFERLSEASRERHLPAFRRGAAAH